MFEEQAESFPGAERLFRAAFALREPYPEVLRLINQHPDDGAVIDCVLAYTYAAQQAPERAEHLAAVLLRLRDGPDAPSLPGVQQGLTHIYYQVLADIHNTGLFVDFGDTTSLNSKNPYLIHSYLSAVSLKHGLTNWSPMFGVIADGLDATRDVNIREQTILFGACIQLLFFGSGIVPIGSAFWSGPDDIAEKLRRQKGRGLIKEKEIERFLDVGVSRLPRSSWLKY